MRALLVAFNAAGAVWCLQGFAYREITFIPIAALAYMLADYLEDLLKKR